MGATVIDISSDVKRQRVLLQAFKNAASMLDEITPNDFLNLNRYEANKHIQEVIHKACCYIPSDNGIREIFHAVYIAAIFKFSTRFELVDIQDKSSVDEMMEYAKNELEESLIETAVATRLLPPAAKGWMHYG